MSEHESKENNGSPVSSTEDIVAVQSQGQGSIYPYLVTRLSSALYHVRDLSQESREALIEFAIDRSRRLQMRCCLVFGPSDCLYFEPTGTCVHSETPPSGGLVKRGPLSIRRNGADTGELID